MQSQMKSTVMVRGELTRGNNPRLWGEDRISWITLRQSWYRFIRRNGLLPCYNHSLIHQTKARLSHLTFSQCRQSISSNLQVLAKDWLSNLPNQLNKPTHRSHHSLLCTGSVYSINFSHVQAESIISAPHVYRCLSLQFPKYRQNLSHKTYITC